MKNIFNYMFIFLIWCSKGEKMKYMINGKMAIFTLKDNIVSSNTLDGKLVLKNYVSSFGGNCDE